MSSLSIRQEVSEIVLCLSMPQDGFMLNFILFFFIVLKLKFRVPTNSNLSYHRLWVKAHFTLFSIKRKSWVSQHPPGLSRILNIQTEKKHLKTVYFVNLSVEETGLTSRNSSSKFSSDYIVFEIPNQGKILALSKKTQHAGFNCLRDVRLLQLHTLSSKQQ